MAGLYIHIPYCKKACFYCDFHFSVNTKNIEEMNAAIIKDLEYNGQQGQNYLAGEPLKTIYFGGGTPSVLSKSMLQKILEAVFLNFEVDPNAEITLEANPDNLSPVRSIEFKSLGINRLSIGIQSFYNEHLQWMNRSHHAADAKSCVQNALDSGINVISVDLIYGFSGLSNEQWESNLETIQKLDVNHLSCYSLTVEDKTPLKKLIDTGRYMKQKDEDSVRHFRMLTQWAQEQNWEHYEVSNFAKNGMFSKHNTAYWKGEKYLGIGPSAHSYNKTHRRWNVRDNNLYIKAWQLGAPEFEEEKLSAQNNYNEYVLTSLRTSWGLNMEKASTYLAQDFYKMNETEIEKYLAMGLLLQQDGILKLSPEGKLYADGIASDFFQ